MLQAVAVAVPARIRLGDGLDIGKRNSLDAYLEFCRANPDLRVERTPEGEIILMPPAGFESSFRNAEVTERLKRWGRRDGRGAVADSSAQFLLPDGSVLSPDAAWVSNKSLARLTSKQRAEFLALSRSSLWKCARPAIVSKQRRPRWSNGSRMACNWPG